LAAVLAQACQERTRERGKVNKGSDEEQEEEAKEQRMFFFSYKKMGDCFLSFSKSEWCKQNNHR
jgi:hypothetical protein